MADPGGLGDFTVRAAPAAREPDIQIDENKGTLTVNGVEYEIDILSEGSKLKGERLKAHRGKALQVAAGVIAREWGNLPKAHDFDNSFISTEAFAAPKEESTSAGRTRMTRVELTDESKAEMSSFMESVAGRVNEVATGVLSGGSGSGTVVDVVDSTALPLTLDASSVYGTPASASGSTLERLSTVAALGTMAGIARLGGNRGGADCFVDASRGTTALGISARDVANITKGFGGGGPALAMVYVTKSRVEEILDAITSYLRSAEEEAAAASGGTPLAQFSGLVKLGQASPSIFGDILVKAVGAAEGFEITADRSVLPIGARTVAGSVASAAGVRLLRIPAVGVAGVFSYKLPNEEAVLLTVRKQPKDGNCLFHAVAEFMNTDARAEGALSDREVRQAAVEELWENRSDYRDNANNAAVDTLEDEIERLSQIIADSEFARSMAEDSVETAAGSLSGEEAEIAELGRLQAEGGVKERIDYYLKWLATDKKFGGPFELMLLANKYPDLKFRVLQKNPSDLSSKQLQRIPGMDDVGSGERLIYLLYDKDNKHYDWLQKSDPRIEEVD